MTRGKASRAAHPDLEPLFCPQSIAVIGASRKPGTVGYALAHNLVYGGYTGVVYPVNPQARSILGNRCIPSISAIDEPVDLVVLAIPAPLIEKAIIEAADHGTRHFVVISAGFKEIGGEGKAREERLKVIARERDLVIVGPNCLGVINTAPTVCMNATFGKDMPAAGSLGLISQSGALCTALLDYAKGIGIGFSRFISFGNKAAVSELDLLRSLATDPYTKVILMYVEELGQGQVFVETCYEITHGANPKPILAIKTGRTSEGAAAAASHTGSLAGSDEVYDAIMTQAGVMRVESVKDLFDYAEVFADPILPHGRSTAIVTNAGGPGIMATDACIRGGLKLARFQEYTLKSLRYQMPATASIKNPVDVIGDARSDRYRAALDAVTSDEGVDQILVIVTPQTMTDVTEIAEVIRESKSFCGKPIVGSLMGHVDVGAGVQLLQKSGVPTYTFPEDAMRAMAAKCRFAEWTRSKTAGYKQFEVDDQAVARIMQAEAAAGRNQLVELKALELFQHYGFPTVPFKLAQTAEEAAAAAAEMEFPVVLKISGPEILHKTDVGGVRLNLTDEDAVKTAFNEMVATVKAKMGPDVEVWGVLVQKMLPIGKEIILGMTRDPRFGPLLMFGLGGIYTEALRDVSFRLAPLRQEMPGEMIKEIRSYRLLGGVRGEKPSDVDAIVDCLLRLSQLVTEHPNIKELDINPLMVYSRGQGAMVVDARIILADT
ncbi:MAG: acetate--CoA ligase family protein [Planctomycetota bacterium]